ncbi:hypothetical protein INR49_029259 [Caranx melampygus]|nr:hypothetical protein INR49_029259 [Caranx melampygus]
MIFGTLDLAQESLQLPDSPPDLPPYCPPRWTLCVECSDQATAGWILALGLHPHQKCPPWAQMRGEEGGGPPGLPGIEETGAGPGQAGGWTWVGGGEAVGEGLTGRGWLGGADRAFKFKKRHVRLLLTLALAAFGERCRTVQFIVPEDERDKFGPGTQAQRWRPLQAVVTQDVKQELQLQQGHGVSRVGRQRQEAMLLAPGQQVLLKQPGEVLQAGSWQGQRAAAIQDQVTWREEETIQLSLRNLTAKFHCTAKSLQVEVTADGHWVEIFSKKSRPHNACIHHNMNPSGTEFVVAEVLINASCQIYQPETRTTSACWQTLVKPYPSHGTNKKQSLVAGWPARWMLFTCEKATL